MVDITSSAPLDTVLQRAMDRRRSALMAMDLDQLAELLDDSLRYTHSNGACEDKAGYLAALAGGKYVYHSVDESDVEAFDLIGGVWCAGSVRMHATVQGVERRMHNRFVAIWRRTADGLRLAAYCATPIPAGT